MKITVGQLNTIPNDFAGNLAQIITGIKHAIQGNTDMVVFPELAICGYGVQDLVYQDGFVEKNLASLEAIKTLSKDYDGYIVVGHVGHNMTGFGKPFHNMLSIVKNGYIIGNYKKMLLPYYQVFSENRWFEPGNDLCLLKIEDKICSFHICEDLYYSDSDGIRHNHAVNPIQMSQDAGANLIISINSSPWHSGKPGHRENLFKKLTVDHKVDIIYVNQIGGNDDLLFDGNSCQYTGGCAQYIFPYNQYGKCNYANVDVDHFRQGKVSRHPYPQAEGLEGLYDMLIVGLRDYVVKSGFKSIVLGSSGGIDSALAAKIACDAIGPENVHCIMMPSIYSSEGSVTDAKELHKQLGCNEYLVPISHEDLLKSINTGLNLVEYNKTADENIQARIRGQIVMHYSNAMGALAIGTGNKVETAVGYSTIFGDSANCFNPLIDLYKTEIFALAETRKLPKNIWTKPPSAELKPGQTDEATLLPYLVLDYIVESYIEKDITNYAKFLKYINSSVKFQRLKDTNVFNTWKSGEYPDQEKHYHRIIGLINRSEFKRRLSPMGIKVTAKSFGSGRRVPVVAKY